MIAVVLHGVLVVIHHLVEIVGRQRADIVGGFFDIGARDGVLDDVRVILRIGKEFRHDEEGDGDDEDAARDTETQPREVIEQADLGGGLEAFQDEAGDDGEEDQRDEEEADGGDADGDGFAMHLRLDIVGGGLEIAQAHEAGEYPAAEREHLADETAVEGQHRREADDDKDAEIEEVHGRSGVGHGTAVAVGLTAF